MFYPSYMVRPIIFIISDHILALNIFNISPHFSCNLCFYVYSHLFEKFKFCFFYVVVVVVVVVDAAVCCYFHTSALFINTAVTVILSYCVFLFTFYFPMYLIRFADSYL